MKLALSDKLKKKQHKDIALLQDLVVDIIYEVFQQAVVHGGTAIWRCYNGTRFSEDIDVYLDKTELKKIDLFKEKLEQRRLNLQKLKVTENAVYAKIILNNVEVRFEASFLNTKTKNIITKPYETIEGNYMNVFTLSPEDLIKEKADAYLSRYLIKDIYDIAILMNFAERTKEVKESLRKLISNYKKPVDESILKSLIFIGAVPSAEQIIENIKKWAR